LALFARQPQCRERISRKLWEFFAYPEPEAEVLAALDAAWQANDGEIRAVLRALFNHPAFLSAQAERAIYKSPVDFIAGSLRALGIQRVLGWIIGLYRAGVRKPLGDVGGFVLISMQNMGQLLLHPPNVAGWPGGSAWINSANMLERVKFADFANPKDDNPLGGWLAKPLRSSDAAGFTAKLLERLDAPLEAEKRAVIERAVAPLYEPDGKDNGPALHLALRLAFAAPEYQML
jgi:hypothetical protein